MASIVRVAVLIWADLLAWFAMWVMVTYLTNEWKISVIHAAGIVNISEGTAAILSVVFAFFVDAFMGNYYMLLLSSIAYTIGLGLLSLSTPTVLRSHSGIGDTQKVLFYTAISLIVVGIAGHMVSLVPFLNEQDTEKGRKFLLQLPGIFIVVIVGVIGALALPYIKPWSIRFGVPAICTLFATLLFLSGSLSYNKVSPTGSSLTILLRVFIAFTSNMFKPLPNNTDQLYEHDGQGLRSLPRTPGFRCLDKAAIKPTTREEQKQSKWRLCRITEVEETKVVIRMIPVWITFIICGIVLSVGNTYFLEQANHMNRKIGKVNVPFTFFLLMSNFSKLIFPKLYTKISSPWGRYAPRIGIAVAMIFSILGCITAAIVETRRLEIIQSHHLQDKPNATIPMKMFWLLPQFLLLGAHEGIYKKCVASFFADQAPQWILDKYRRSFSNGMLGLGFMSSVLSVYVVRKVSEMGGKSWFQHTLSKSHLDYYYWILAGLSALNLVYYMVLLCLYTYGDSKVEDQEVPQTEGISASPANDNTQMLAIMTVDTSNSKLHDRESEWSDLSRFHIKYLSIGNSNQR
ncbi:protein NRT1/ PTR FAMILY 5.5 [Apium graveolens]|uniref:protein NRT1/ PTR FAMILY 5.5 n=1 Tax=Apium graveolens TaxID=4045 RepID=UPI003D794D3A